MSPPAASDRALSVVPLLRRLLADGRMNPPLGFPERYCSDTGSGGDGSTEPTSEAPSRSTALTRCLRKSLISGMTKDGSRSRLSNHGPRTSSCGLLARLRRASGPRDLRSLVASVVGAADRSAPSSPTRRWPAQSTAAYLNTVPGDGNKFLQVVRGECHGIVRKSAISVITRDEVSRTT